MAKLFVAVYHHRFGEDVYPFFQDAEPSEEDVIKEINRESEWEPEREEWIEFFGPYLIPVEGK